MSACPYLHDNRCTAREARPLGCRVFFCDPAWRGKGEDLTERFLRRIGALSERLGIERDYRPFLEHLDTFRSVQHPAGEHGEASWPS
jgi:Fe-S-cluster containining protein